MSPTAKQSDAAPRITFADLYDQLVGANFWHHWWAAFERLQRTHELPFTTALDAACGTGETVKRLRGQGIAADGCDLSADMIRVARHKCAATGARLWVQAMENLTTRRPVELLLCSYDSLNMVTDPRALARTFDAFFAAIRPGGHLICDLATIHHLARDWGDNEIHTQMGGIDTIWHTRWRPEAQQLTIHLTATVPDGAGGIQVVTERVIEQGYRQAQLEAMISAAGFQTVALHDMIPWTPGSDDGERLFYLLRRP